MKSLAKTINSDKNMTDNKMTPEQFVKRWLPEYNKRWNAFIADWNLEWGHDPSPANQGLWLNKRFPAALAAYTDHVRKEAWDQACRKTKRECAKHLTGYDGEHEPDELSAKILNAPAPEFKITEK